MRTTVEDRFWAKVNKAGPTPPRRPELGPCWIWTAGLAEGYGQFRYPGGHSAYRYAYELLVGPVPEGLQLDHLCRNRACVNPAHLEPVTALVNQHRGETIAARNAAKTHCPQGHEFTPENTYVNSKGSRECLICRRITYREAQRRARARKRGAM